MNGIVLAAGFAQRMHPLTLDRPKALLPLGDATILDRILARIEPLRPTRTVVVSNAAFFGQFQAWLAALPLERRSGLMLINDGSTSPENRRGAIGALHYALNGLPDDDALVVAGDNVFSFDLGRLRALSISRQAPVVALRDLKDPALVARKFGVAELAHDGRIIAFEEKPAEPRSALASTACYLFPSESLEWLRVYVTEHPKADNLGSFLGWLAARTPVYGVVFGDPWYDIGTIEDYQALKDRADA